MISSQLYPLVVLCCIMFGTSVLTCPKIQSSLDYFTQIVHKVFEHSSRLMTFPPRLAQILRLPIWRDFEANVDEVLREGAAIIDHCIRVQEDQRRPHDEALYHRLQAADVPGDMIKRIFVDLVIAAGDTVSNPIELQSPLLIVVTPHLDRIQQSVGFVCPFKGAEAPATTGQGASYQ